jgi:UDP-glucose 4-epimerase
MGSHLVDRLLERGQYVRVYDRGLNEFHGMPAGAEYVEGELGNHGLIREAVEGMEVVYHLVSTTLPKTSNDDPIYDVRSNLVDTIQLLNVCVAAGVRKVIFASSGGTVYGVPKTVPISETHPTDPISSYGIAKLAIEKYLRLFNHLHKLDYTVLRISNPYGPYQSPASQQGVISVFLHRIYTGQPITVWGDGSVVRDYLYISDVIDALEAVGRAETQEKLFNIGSGHGTSLNDLIELMAAVVREQPTVEYLPSRSLDVPVSVLDVSRARRELGWGPKIDLTEGIARTWEWLRSLSKSRVEGLAYQPKRAEHLPDQARPTA